jgi:hypothetical protein
METVWKHLETKTLKNSQRNLSAYVVRVIGTDLDYGSIRKFALRVYTIKL